MTRSAAQRFVELGLQLNRHVDGTVDAYFGPREWAMAVEAAPPVEPRTLVASAEALLDELADGWLRDQVVGLRTYAGVLAGEELSYADEVEGCFGVRPTHVDEAVFSAAHERLDELLPGTESLVERYQQWRTSILVSAEQLERTIQAIILEARDRSREFIELPDGEGVELQFMRDKAWHGYNAYLGDLRGRVSVNVDVPTSAVDLLHLVIHETYPGHQAERVAKEQLLVRDQGLIEETIVVAPTPQSLVAEGIGELAPELLLDGDGLAGFGAILRDAGVQLDLEHALEVERARKPCHWATVNAALMLHDAGAGDTEISAYVQHWGLVTADTADRLIRFISEPTSRTYVVNYPAGLSLCRAYVGNEPERFRRLLTEQVRVRDLVAATDATTGQAS